MASRRIASLLEEEDVAAAEEGLEEEDEAETAAEGLEEEDEESYAANAALALVEMHSA